MIVMNGPFSSSLHTTESELSSKSFKLLLLTIFPPSSDDSKSSLVSSVIVNRNLGKFSPSLKGLSHNSIEDCGSWTEDEEEHKS
ncbi:hypothetical protein MIMGU_mgv1a017297mg [Erythranthe guttata]|uniref:Uncharacterized protein n=1 Tax=Erythranthe guttata TaxID=4155 RepID=A0A022R0T5_ERYGU|nr:hypothetical protein MIMGU_mgv1a017297mg [Erythranthe guttata]